MAVNMARKPAGKSGKTPNEKVQLSLPPATLKRLRIAAAELGLDLSEVVAELIDTRFPGVHVRGMNSTPGAAQATGQGGYPPQIPSGPSYVQNMPTTEPEADEEPPVTAANVMTTLPQPTAGPGMMKRSKIISESYAKATAPIDGAIDDLGGR